VARSKKKTSPIPGKAKSQTDSSERIRLHESTENAPDTQSINKIRDILFGNQVKAFEKRFVNLENQVQNQIKEIRDEIHKRLDAIEAIVKKEVDALSSGLKAEASVRDEITQQISEAFKDETRKLTVKIEALEENQDIDARDLKKQLLDFSKNLTGEIQKHYRKSSNELAQAVKELNENKVGRKTLSEILIEMAIKTSDDLAKKINLEMNEMKNA
jgi:hypothetical protein